MSNVITLDVITKLDIPADRVIKAVQDLDIQDIVVLGYLESGEFYFASNLADGGSVMLLLETAKKRLMEVEL